MSVQHKPLAVQLRWFIRLRWFAAIAILVGSALDRWWFHTLPESAAILWVGVAVLIYNIILSQALERIAAQKHRGRALMLLAWSSLLLDFGSLTLLIIWTGGLLSPLARFYVLHMVFASVLLPRRMAYAGAAAAILIQTTGLVLAGQLPADRQAHILGITQAIVLFLVVFLANRITRDLRRQHRRLAKQNARIRKMSRQVRRQHRAMIQHEKMAALGQMAAGVAHEIANPLSSMDSLLQLLQRKPEKLTAESIQTLREQVSRINQIIRQMKTFAHPDDAQQQMLPLNEVVERALKLLHFDPRMARVHVKLDLSRETALAPVSAQALEQVLVNLMINALDAMADVSEPELTVTTSYRAGHCLVEVTDNGHGISPQHMQRLFEPFFTTKPVGKGTGLGLSISYSLLRRIGGDITARSEEGEGTTFTLVLPTPRGSQNWEQPAAAIGGSGKFE